MGKGLGYFLITLGAIVLLATAGFCLVLIVGGLSSGNDANVMRAIMNAALGGVFGVVIGLVLIKVGRERLG